jgi:membrane-bound serine protease (ClpP class)
MSFVAGGGIAIILAIVVFIVLSPYLPKVPMFGRLVLQAQSTGAEQLPASIPAETGPAEAQKRRDIVGLKGVAVTDLRPSGKMRVGDEYYDVTTRGDYVEKDTEIEITQIEGNTIFVRELR